MKRIVLLATLLAGSFGIATGQASPPALINYQGVLRSAAGAPLTGSFDMVFRFHSADVGGDEILVDTHTLASGGQVAVTGGLFNVSLGSGTVSDGSGPGSYASPSEAFRDYAAVYLSVQVGGETLAPRVRMLSAPYSLNADHLDGIGSGSFLRSDAADSYTSGTLTFSPGTTLKLPDGTALATPIAFTNDPGSGMYLGPDGLVLASSGTPVLSGYISGDVSVTGRIAPNYDGVSFEALSFDHFNSTFHLTDDLNVGGNLTTAGRGGFLEGLTVGSLNSTTPYTRFIAGGSPSSGTMNDAGDVFVQNQLEVDGAVFLNGELRMDDNGPDGNQTVYFYNGASPTGESIAWNEAGDRFELSDDLFLAGTLDLGGGADDDLTAADVTTLTGGGNADALHTHANAGNADTLDALDSTAFARIGIGNTFTTGTQTVQTGAPATKGVVVRGAAAQTANMQEWQDSGGVARAAIGPGGTLALNTGGGPDSVFAEDGIDRSNGASDATFTIQNSGGAGKMTLQVDGVIRAGDPLLDPTNYAYNRIALGVTAPPAGASMSLRNDLFVEGDVGVNGQVYAGTRVIAESVIVVGDTTPSTSQAYSSFGGSVPDEAFITDASDVFVSGDLEIDGQLSTGTIHGSGLAVVLAADSSIRSMIDNDNNSTGAFAEWFHDGSFTNASKLAELQEDGDLRIGGTLSQNVVFDLAEAFLQAEPVAAGDLVRVDPSRGNAIRLTRGEGDRALLGVVSARPGFLLGGAPFDAAALGKTWGEDVLARFRAEKDALETDVLAAHPDLRAEREALARIGDVAGEKGVVVVPAIGDAVAAASAAAAHGAGAGLPGPSPGRQQQGEAAARQGRVAELAQRLESAALETFYERHFAAVALAGRVPVKIDGRFGEIRPGDLLGPSPDPGVAMKVTAGPVIGTALEGFFGGRGTIVAFVHRGQAGPGADERAIHGTSESVADDAATRAAPVAASQPDPATGMQAVPGNLQIVLDKGGDDRARFSISRDGQEGLGSEVFRVDEEGNVYARGSIRPSSLDLAEYHPVSEPVGAGDVLVVDRGSPGKLRRGATASDPAVVGIVSSGPGVLMGGGLGRIAAAAPELADALDDARRRGDRAAEARLWAQMQSAFERTHAPLALSGTVLCKVDAEYGAVAVGDLLATSPTAGHAMRAVDPAPGTIVGKALEPLASGSGLIRVLVMIR